MCQLFRDAMLSASRINPCMCLGSHQPPIPKSNAHAGSWQPGKDTHFIMNGDREEVEGNDHDDDDAWVDCSWAGWGDNQD